jgi:hypothetical protein
MTKATAAYATMFLLLVGGLWAILRIGAGLQAPADLRGAWAVRWDDGRAEPFNAMTVEQSGLFVELITSAGPTSAGPANTCPALRGRLNTDPSSNGGPSNRISGQARSSDRRWVISLHQSADGAELLGTLESPGRRAFTARRASAETSSAAAPAPQTVATSD